MTNCELIGLEHRWTEDGAYCKSCGLVTEVTCKSMNINNLDELKHALTEMEGSGVASCWDDNRPNMSEYTLMRAIEKYNEIPEDEREHHNRWYECIYGNGGYSRYFVNMGTGEVTFSAFHSYSTKIEKAKSLGFKLH